LIEVLLSLAARGRSVIVGRGSPYVLPAATTLRVRLFAPPEDRIAFVSHERQIPRTEAARFVELNDRQRAQFVRLHFQRDSSDVHNYDLALNTAQFSIEQCANLIVDALQTKSQEGAAPTAGFHREPLLAGADDFA
jgi:cytidylate kinase